MEEVHLEVRQAIGSRAANRLRRAGLVPGVIYGRGREPRTVAVEAGALRALQAAGQVGVVRLRLDGEEVAALVKAVQTHPITGQLRSVDFHAVSLEEKVTVSVPVHLVGTPVGVSTGGVLEHIMRQVQVSCRASQIPAHLEVDVSGLSVGQSVHLGDVRTPEGVETVGARDEVVVLVVAPTKHEEEVKPEEVAVAEAPAEGEEAKPAAEEPARPGKAEQ